MIASHPDSALPHYRFADANLQMGNFAEAATAAATALRLDQTHRKARYVSGMALVRVGRTAEGEKELQAYQKQEADAQAEINEQRDVVVSNRGASALLRSGEGEAALESFRKSIEAHPNVTSLRFNAGIALTLLGRHREAAAALQTLLDSGLNENFLVDRALAHEFESLQDEMASQKYSALYIRKADAALEEALQ